MVILFYYNRCKDYKYIINDCLIIKECIMIHDSLVNLFETYIQENEKFVQGNKAAGTRARKALAEISKLCKERRKEIQESKNS